MGVNWLLSLFVSFKSLSPLNKIKKTSVPRIYGLNGNLLSKTAKTGIDRPDWTYAYDALDQLISVSRGGIEVERYRYDAFGHRSAIDTIDQARNFERIAIVNDSSDQTIDLIEVVDVDSATNLNMFAKHCRESRLYDFNMRRGKRLDARQKRKRR